MENELRKLGSVELVATTKALVEKERAVGIQVLHHLREIDRRRLFAERGYSSLHEFCVKEFKYSDGAAHRRISAMRLIRDVPQAEAAIAEARISMTNAAMLQGFLRSERVERKKTYSTEEKLGLLAKLEGKSSRECNQTLAAISPQAIPRERERVLSETETEIRFVANARVQRMLRRLRELTAHSVRTGGYAELIEKSLEIALKAIDPMEKGKGLPERRRTEGMLAPKPAIATADSARNLGVDAKAPARIIGASAQKLATDRAPERKSQPSSSGANTGSVRYIPRPLFREVWRRDDGRCTFIDPLTKRRCEARYGLHIDHIQPLALGGATESRNLRLTCRAHNQLLAIREFGSRKMGHFIPGMKD